MATIQELLKMQGGGASRIRADVNFLLKQIEQNMKKAEQEDREKAVGAQKGGEIGLKGIKTRKDYLLAKRANPNLTFKNFLLNPDVAGKNMEEGVSNIVSGQSPEINLREMLGIGDGGDYRTVNKGNFQSVNTGPTTSYPAPVNRGNFQSVDTGPTTSYPAPMTPAPMPTKIGALNPNFKFESFNSQVDLPKAPAPSYNKMQNELDDLVRKSAQGLKDRLTAGQVPFDELGQRAGVNLPFAEGSYSNPISMEGVDAVMPESSSAVGTAGNVLGKTASKFKFGKGLYDMGTNKITPSNFASTLGAGVSLVPGLQPIGFGLSTLGALLNRNKYNRG